MTDMTGKPQRWTQAVVEPDMWVDPDVDPRGTGTPSPDGELPTLDDYLRHFRLTLVMKCEGLDPGQLAERSVPPSGLSLLGLVRHLASAEHDWRGWVEPGESEGKLYGSHDAAFDDAVGDQEAVEAAYADLAREQAATDAVLARHPDLDERVGEHAIAVREILLHRVEEYARHCGHADLLRECIDGRVGQ